MTGARTRLLLLAAVFPALALAGCSEKGPAEKTGEKLDNIVEEVKDKIDPAGPAEKAGRKIDDAVEDIKDRK